MRKIYRIFMMGWGRCLLGWIWWRLWGGCWGMAGWGANLGGSLGGRCIRLFIWLFCSIMISAAMQQQTTMVTPIMLTTLITITPIIPLIKLTNTFPLRTAPYGYPSSSPCAITQHTTPQHPSSQKTYCSQAQATKNTY